MEKSEEKKLPESQPVTNKQDAPSSAAVRGKKALRRILKKGKRKLKGVKRRLVKATRLLSGTVNTKSAAAYGTPEEFESCVTAAMAEAGWSWKEAEAQVRATARKLKLRYVDYAKYHYCLISPEEQARYQQVIWNVAHKPLMPRPEKKCSCPPPSLDRARISQIAREAGWTREQAVLSFLNTYALTGSSLKEYIHYRMYDLDESAQQKVLNRLVNKKLCARYDKPSLVRLLSYKEFTNSFFAEYFRRAWCVNTAVSLQEFSYRFQKCSRIIYKPIAGHRGNSVEAFDLNAANMESVYRTLSQYPMGVVEEYVRQHPEMSRLNPDSVNTIRVVSFSSNSFPVTEDGKMMDIAVANVRIGGGGSIVDNFHNGGVTANIDLETGKIRTHAVDYEGKVFRKHPATGTVIKGFEIPYFQEALNMIRDAIETRRLEGYIGWDVAIAEDGPLLIEINTMPGVGGLQTIYTPLKRGMKPLMAKYLAVDPFMWVRKNEAEADASAEAAEQAELDATENTAPASLSPEEELALQKKREAREKAACLKKTMAATGWSKEQALAHIEDARARLGVSYQDYRLTCLYGYGPEDQRAHYEEILAKRAARHEKREALLLSVAEATGWTPDQAKAQYGKAKERFNLSLEDYCTLKLHLVEPERQMLRVREQIEQAEIEDRERAASLKLAMSVMRWSEEEAAARLDESRAKLHVSYHDYRNLKLYRYELDEQKRRYQEYVEAREQEEKDRAACLKAVLHETSWNRDFALSRIEEATKRLGVSYRDYRLMRLYRYAPEKQAEQRDKILAKRAREKAEKDELVKAVAEASGWSFERAEQQMAKAEKSAGISYKNYLAAELYLYDPAEQEARYREFLALGAAELRDKRACVKAVREATGWTASQAEAQIEDARKRLGVSYQDYRTFELYRYSPEEQKAAYQRKHARLSRKKTELEGVILSVAKSKRWTRQKAREALKQDMASLGVTPLEYRALKLYRFTPERRAAEFKQFRASFESCRDKIRRLGMRSIEITGSYGKTTTTSMIEAMLKSKHRVLGQLGRNNNTYSWTIKRIEALDNSYDFYLQEASEGPLFGVPGVISGMVQPEIAVVTSVGTSHIEWLGSQEYILGSCLSLQEGMPEDGILVLNGDDPVIAAAEVEHRAVYFGIENENADYRAVNIVNAEDGIHFDILHDGVSTPVILHCIGLHNVIDAVAAFAVGKLCGMSDEDAAAGLGLFRTSGIRQNLVMLGGYRFFLDCYNASVESMQSSVEAISSLALPEGGRRIALLADIKESGENSEEYHRTVGRFIAGSQVDILICYGEYAQLIAEEARRNKALAVYSVSSHEEAAELLRSISTSADIILLKGSHAMSLERVADILVGTSFHEGDEDSTTAVTEHFSFQLFGDHATLSRCTDSADEVRIPRSVCELPVTAIGEGAFLASPVKSVVLPDTIRSLRRSAFKNAALESVTLPGSLMFVASDAFSGCKALKKAVFNEGCLHIDDSVFQNCSALETVVLPASLRQISPAAFPGCERAVFFCPEGSYARSYAEAQGFELGDHVKLPAQEQVFSSLSYPQLPECPYMPKISSISKAGIEYYWKKPEVAEGYEIFRSYSINGPFEMIRRLEKRNYGTCLDSSFDHDRRTVYYTVRSYVFDAEGNRVYSKMLEPTPAQYLTELSLERKVTYMYSGISRKLRASYGWGEPADAEWSSDDESVAAVDPDGTIRALSSGSCTLTCRCPEIGQSAVSRVVVDRRALEPLAEPEPRYHFDGQDGCWKQNSPAAEHAGEAVIVMAGDMMCGSRQMTDQATEDGDWNFNESYDFIRLINAKADFAIGNLETLQASGWPYMTEEGYINNTNNCNAPSRYLDAVCHGLFDALAMSNNHNCDGGPKALLETIGQVDRYRLARTGVFADLSEPRFLIADINGIKVGFLAYLTPTTGYNGKDRSWSEEDKTVLINTFTADKAVRDIAACRAAGAEYVIVYMHWGQKNFRVPTPQQLQEAQLVADAGADYIVGSNPHLVQRFETLTAADGRSVPCCYSVGNFHSVMSQVPGNRDSALLRVCLKRNAEGKVELKENSYIATHTCKIFLGRKWVILPLAATSAWKLPSDAKNWLSQTQQAIGEQISLIQTL